MMFWLLEHYICFELRVACENNFWMRSTNIDSNGWEWKENSVWVRRNLVWVRRNLVKEYLSELEIVYLKITRMR